MKLSIITPEKMLIDTDVQMVTIPGTEGDFGVLIGHAPFISTLREGVITVDFQNGEKKEFPITSGIAEVTPEKCVILSSGMAA